MSIRAKWIYNAILLIGFLAVGFVLGEMTLRFLHPEFLETKLNSDGLPQGQLAEFLTDIRENKPQFIVIGDSYVETGVKERGWIRDLRSSTGRTISAFGLSGAGPYHYFSVYDRVRAVDPAVPILIVFYLGNDLVDESILHSVAPRYDRYLQVRREVFSNDKGQPYWPCFEPGGAEIISVTNRILRFFDTHFVSFKLAKPVWYQIKEAVLSLNVDINRHPAQDILLSICNRPPHSVMVNGRLFFFELHNYSIDRNVASNMESWLRVKQYLTKRVHDKKLTLVVALDREEVCENFHKIEVKKGKEMISEFENIGVRVINPNLEFSEECMSKELYLPDGHWNYTGHKLFAQIMEREWIRNQTQR